MNRSPTRLLANPSGSALALALMALLILSGVALSLGSLSIINGESARRDESSTRAAYIARAAMERACAEVLNNTPQWDQLPTGALYTGEAFAGGSYDVNIVSANPDKAVLLITTTVEGQTNEFEIDILRRTDTGNTSGITMGASFGPLRDLGLGIVNQSNDSLIDEEEEEEDDDDGDGD